jgi:AAA15 family ATPase/GTPase
MEKIIQKIKNLQVKGFRGIVENDLPFEGKSIVLCGENGQGKSSFVDALEFFFKGKLQYLEDVKTTSTVRHAPHIKHKKTDSSVSIEFVQGATLLCRTFKDCPVIPAQLKIYFNLGGTSHYILRRKYLLDFLISQAAPRYTQLAALMGISELDNVELNMMRKRDEIDQEIQSLETRLKEMRKRLNEKHKEEIISDAQLIEVVNKSIGKYTKQIVSSIEDIPGLKPKLVGEKKDSEVAEKRTNLKGIMEDVNYLKSNISFLGNHKELWSSIQKLHKNIEKLEEAAFQQILSSGKNIILEKKMEVCPLCQQPISRAEVVSVIEKRLKDLEATQGDVERIKELKRLLVADLSLFLERLNGFIEKIKKAGYTASLNSLESVSANLAKLKTQISKEVINIQLEPAVAYIDDKTAPLLFANEERWLDAELKKVAGSKEDEDLVGIIDLLTATYETYNEIKRSEKDLVNKKKFRKQIDAIYQCFLTTNHDEIQRIYDELGSDFYRYYKELHPGDEHHDIKLVVKRRASAEIKTKFYDKQEEDPRGFFSEAHLDSLGLCIFLAFVKKFNANFPLIILDDVVSSIDASHRNRIGKLIFEEFPDQQLLITTHDNIWFEELCNAERAFGVAHKFNNLRIIRWSLDGGPVLDKYKPKWEEITEKLNKGDKQGVGNAGRTCLDWILFEMCVHLLVNTPTKRDNRYETSEMYLPLKDRIKKLLPDIYQQNEKIFQDLEANSFFGNLLSHHNPDAANVSIGELKDFVNSIKALYDFFYCGTCSEFVQYHQAAKVVKCTKGCKNWGVK